MCIAFPTKLLVLQRYMPNWLKRLLNCCCCCFCIDTRSNLQKILDNIGPHRKRDLLTHALSASRTTISKKAGGGGGGNNNNDTITFVFVENAY